MKKEYKMALAEVNQILMYTKEDVVSKIPEKFKKFVENNMDQNHIIEINKNKSLVEQNIMEETKQILALIYRDYICLKEERANLILQEQRIEKEKREKYNINFEKRNERKNIVEERVLIDYKEEKWYEKIINKVLRIFKLKK